MIDQNSLSSSPFIVSLCRFCAKRSPVDSHLIRTHFTHAQAHTWWVCIRNHNDLSKIKMCQFVENFPVAHRRTICMWKDSAPAASNEFYQIYQNWFRLRSLVAEWMSLNWTKCIVLSATVIAYTKWWWRSSSLESLNPFVRRDALARIGHSAKKENKTKNDDEDDDRTTRNLKSHLIEMNVAFAFVVAKHLCFFDPEFALDFINNNIARPSRTTTTPTNYCDWKTSLWLSRCAIYFGSFLSFPFLSRCCCISALCQ